MGASSDSQSTYFRIRMVRLMIISIMGLQLQPLFLWGPAELVRWNDAISRHGILRGFRRGWEVRPTLDTCAPQPLFECLQSLWQENKYPSPGSFSRRFGYFWHWCVAPWPATGLLCSCQRVSASRPPYWTPRTPYICQPDLFNQRTSVQAPAFGFPPSSTPLIPHIFATIPFLSATKVTIVPQGTHIPTYCQRFSQHELQYQQQNYSRNNLHQ